MGAVPIFPFFNSAKNSNIKIMKYEKEPSNSNKIDAIKTNIKILSDKINLSESIENKELSETNKHSIDLLLLKIESPAHASEQ